jgi:hypothetical protein
LETVPTDTPAAVATSLMLTDAARATLLRSVTYGGDGS